MPEKTCSFDVQDESLPVIGTSHHKLHNDQPQPNFKSFPNCIPKRFIFSFIGFLASTLAVTLNTNLSITIVAMVDRFNETVTQVKSSNECLSNQLLTTDLPAYQKVPLKHGEFHWIPETEGILLGAVYYGQLFGFLPGGRMAEVYGSKRTLISFICLASISTFVAPFAARLSVYAFAVSRFLVGVGTVDSESERSFSASFILAGFGVGAFVSFLSSGILCASEIFGGWPAVFYLGGTLGFAWCIACYIFVSDNPQNHLSITEKELKYITENLGPTKQKQIKKIPWISIIKSRPFWALAIGYVGQFWILGFYCTTQALYMGTILNLESKMNGELSCLPHLTRGLFACVCAFPADWVLKRGYVSKTFVRKAATAINSVFSCLGFMAIILAGCNAQLNTLFFTLGGLLGDFITFGVCMAGVDIAPNLSGTVSGILSFIGVIPFFVIPTLVGYFTKYERSMAQWRSIYYTTIGVVASTTLIFLIFGTSEPQTWGVFDKETESTKEEKSEEK